MGLPEQTIPTSLQFRKGDRVYALDNTFLGNQQHGSFQVGCAPSGALRLHSLRRALPLCPPSHGLTTSILCLQEVVSIPEAHVAHAPKTVPLTEAGGIPLVALTAWQVSPPMPSAVQAEAQTLVPQDLLSAGSSCLAGSSDS